MFDLNLEKTIQMLVDKELDRSKPVVILDNNKYQKPGVYLPYSKYWEIIVNINLGKGD